MIIKLAIFLPKNQNPLRSGRALELGLEFLRLLVGLALPVTGSFAAGPPTRAVICTDSSSPAMDLNTLIPANSGWVLESAKAINDSGEIIGLKVSIPSTFEQHSQFFTIREAP